MTSTRSKPESLWHERLKDAQLQVDFARAYRKELEDAKSGCLASPDGELAYRNAVQAEKLALQKIVGLRKIFNSGVRQISDEQP